MDKDGDAGQTTGTFAFADVTIDAGGHRLLRGGHDIAVEPKAFAVLLEFLAHPDQLLTRNQLLDAVWGHSFVTPATLSRIIAQLRRALADDSEAPRCIQTVHGLGYRFIAPLEIVPEKPVPALRFAPPVRARLPERTEPLIGRDSDIEALKLMLEEHRLGTITGSGENGATVTLFEDLNNNGTQEGGEATLGTAVVSGGTFAADISLAAGATHHVSAFETDVAGNVSAGSAALDIKVDTSASITRTDPRWR